MKNFVLIMLAATSFAGCTSKPVVLDSRTPAATEEFIFFNERGKIRNPNTTAEAVVYLKEYAKLALRSRQAVLDRENKVADALRRLGGMSTTDAQTYLNTPVGRKNTNLEARFQIEVKEGCFWDGGFYGRPIVQDQIYQIEAQILAISAFLSDYTVRSLGQGSVIDPNYIKICSEKITKAPYKFDGDTLEIGLDFNKVTRNYDVQDVHKLNEMWNQGSFLSAGGAKAQVLWQIFNPVGPARSQIRQVLMRNGLNARDLLRQKLGLMNRSPQSLGLMNAFHSYLATIGFNEQDLMKLKAQVNENNVQQIVAQMEAEVVNPETHDTLVASAISKMSRVSTDVNVKGRQVFIGAGANVANYHHIDINGMFAGSTNADFELEVENVKQTINYDVSQFHLGLGANVSTPDFVNVNVNIIKNQVADANVLARGVARKVIRESPAQ